MLSSMEWLLGVVGRHDVNWVHAHLLIQCKLEFHTITEYIVDSVMNESVICIRLDVWVSGGKVYNDWKNELKNFWYSSRSKIDEWSTVRTASACYTLSAYWEAEAKSVHLQFSLHKKVQAGAFSRNPSRLLTHMVYKWLI